ncbi:hypothetical protein BKA08_002087 [Nocardioides marinisabuli]|uniref:Uncharacterized protein n=1 Tax=Nocardioides marinisabuli TaxID=419476 RepID=A0A7Y9JSK9_9ACTN|nr:hypothetical protein [Nocardioides marinisabuli]NYD57849.1 hypothetical protein [Nocardioides marinisabuli]
MLLPELVVHLAPVLELVRLTDEVPEPEDVKAGWGALAIFALMAAAVALLGWSLFRQLRKVEHGRVTGVYGDVPADPEQRPGAEDDADDNTGDAGRA